MKFTAFMKHILWEEKNTLGLLHLDERGLPSALREQIDRTNAVNNIKRIVPFSVLLFFIEALNQGTILLTKAYPGLRGAYLTAGTAMLLLSAGAVFLAYRALSAPTVDVRRCKRLYRFFWTAFSLVMLAFIYLEIHTQGSTNNFFYLLILTAAFPLLSRKEALWLFALDAVAAVPMAVYHGFTPQQLLQLPLITVFALTLSQVLYSSHRANDITMERLEDSNQRLAALAQTDPLTGLLNRRGVEERVEKRLSRCDRTRDVAFLMIDIDLFKSYNDRFGHDQGDQCLQKVAGAIQCCVRKDTDLAARIGGEEFLAVLIGCEAAYVLRTAQRLREEVVKLGLEAATDAVHRYVTVSVGIAATQTPFDFTALYGRADKALYKAKNAGRNRVAQGETVYSNETDTETDTDAGPS